MSDEQFNPGAADTAVVETQETPAAEPNPSASPETPTQGEDGSKEAPPAVAKTFTQAELDDIVRRRTAAAEAKAERRVMRTLERFQPQTRQAPAPASDDGRPARAAYASDEAFVDALTDWKLDQRERTASQQREQQQQRSIVEKSEALYAQAAKEPGFDREDFEALPLTKPIAEAVMDSDIAPKLMAHLAMNPGEVDRIAKLSPARQAAEIGKLETKVASAPAPSRAPPPISTVGARGSASQTNPDQMTQAEYEAWTKKANPRARR